MGDVGMSGLGAEVGNGGVDRRKRTVDCGNEVRPFGSAPTSLITEKIAKGDRVAYYAAVRPADRNSMFRYYSRSTTASLLARSACERRG